MKHHRHLNEHLQTGSEALPCLLLEVRRKQGKDITPYHAAGFGAKGIAARVFLNKLHVAMAAHGRPHLTEFGHHPIALAEIQFERASHEVIQFV